MRVLDVARYQALSRDNTWDNILSVTANEDHLNRSESILEKINSKVTCYRQGPDRTKDEDISSWKDVNETVELTLRQLKTPPPSVHS